MFKKIQRDHNITLSLYPLAWKTLLVVLNKDVVVYMSALQLIITCTFCTLNDTCMLPFKMVCSCLIMAGDTACNYAMVAFA